MVILCHFIGYRILELHYPSSLNSHNALYIRKSTRRIDCIDKIYTESSRGCKGHRGLYTQASKATVRVGQKPWSILDRTPDRCHDIVRHNLAYKIPNPYVPIRAFNLFKGGLTSKWTYIFIWGLYMLRRYIC
jgi:hypothetical protein